MERVIFMGTPSFAQVILQDLLGRYELAAVVTQPDRPAGRGNKLVQSPVKELALAHNLPLLQPRRLREPEVIAQLQRLAPDIIVVAAFGQILLPAVLAIPRHGCLNVHASLLPCYRGAAPIPAAILAGDECTGVTIMLMDSGLDTGPLLTQTTVPISPDDTTASLTLRLAQVGAALLLETMPRWIAGEIKPQPQDNERATFSRQIKVEDARVNWHDTAVHIARLSRAMYPWPVAFTFWEGVKLQILRARPLPSGETPVVPGQVVQRGKDIAVGTGEGLLLLEQVQLAGKRAMPADAFVRGQRTFVGAKLA